MASYKLQWRSTIKKDLRKLPPSEVQRIIKAIDDLTVDPFPHGVEKLAGEEHAYRIRIGDYRVVFEVFQTGKIVAINRIRHRKDVYR